LLLSGVNQIIEDIDLFVLVENILQLSVMRKDTTSHVFSLIENVPSGRFYDGLWNQLRDCVDIFVISGSFLLNVCGLAFKISCSTSLLINLISGRCYFDSGCFRNDGGGVSGRSKDILEGRLVDDLRSSRLNWSLYVHS
jgi:hypothetical protein